MRVLLFLLFFFMLIFSACTSNSGKPEISFYYWKTSFNLSLAEKKLLSENQVKTLFVRYFDVDLNDSEEFPIPVSPVQFELKPAEYCIVPVVYIKNRVMLLKELNSKKLVKNILSYIDQINTKNKIQCTEIQIDCDWTLNSRDRFMKFIELLKKESKKTISVTIRLHQVKYYYKTKIPVADYGVLMYYNMGTISTDSLNSVYDREIAKRYISSLERYPLKLDIALPIFSQTVHIRNKKVINLYSKMNIKQFQNDSNFVVLGKNRVQAKNPTIKEGHYFMKNDELKFETVHFEQLMEMASDLSRNLPDKPIKVIFFDLDSTNLKFYNNEKQNLSQVADGF